MKSVRATIALPFLNRHMRKILTMSLRDARQYFEKITKSNTSPKLHRVVDDTIDHIPIRLYQTKQTHGCLLFFHGGGFSLGSIVTHDKLARLICKFTKRTVISIDYSLAPEHTHPTPVVEATRVIDQLSSLAKRYHFDASDIVLAGDSSGGFIALHTALRCNYPLSSLVLLYPCVTPGAQTESMQTYAHNYFLTASNIRAFWKQYLKDEIITPLTSHTIGLLPPTLIVTAQYDVLRDEARNLYTQMRNLGKPCQYEEVNGVWHGFLHAPNFISNRNALLITLSNFLAMHQPVNAPK